MALRPARIIALAVHRTERGPRETAQRPRMRFAMVEERVADALAAAYGIAVTGTFVCTSLLAMIATFITPSR
mgnify:CR=1 FL=1